jgi:hypothetical protein
MKKILSTLAVGAALVAGALGTAGAASATPVDAQYDGCVKAGTDLYTTSGVSFAVYGRQIAGHISSGLRDPLQERNWVWHNTNESVDWIDANVLVNCATDVYLGFGPGDSYGGSGGGNGNLEA